MPLRLKQNPITPVPHAPSEAIGLQSNESSLVSEIGEVFHTFGADHKHNLDAVLKFVLKKVNAQFAVFHLFDFENRRIITRQEIFCPPGFRRKGRLEGRICYETFVEAKKTHLFLNNVRNSRFWNSDPDLKRYKLSTYIGCPVHVSGKVAGSLALYGQKQGEYDPADARIVCLAANIIAFIEDRRLAENDLRWKFEREKMLSDISASAVSDSDLDPFIAHCFDIIGPALEADSMALYTFEPGHSRLKMMAQWCPNILSGSLLQHDFSDLLSLPMAQEVVETGEVFHCPNTISISDPNVRKILTKHKIRTFLLVPLCLKQKVHGFCSLHRNKVSYPWHDADILALKSAMQIFTQRITRHTMANRLDESEALINQLFQLAPAAIYRIDLKNQRILAANEYLCRETGYTKEELLALNPLAMLTPASRKLYFERLVDIAAGNPVPGNVEFEVVTKSGTVEWGRFHIRHIHEAGQIVGAHVVAHFITEQKKAREALNDYQKNLESEVSARTDDLAKANQALRDEIEQRVHTAEKLQASTLRLKEMNTAMRVLLDKRMEDHRRTEELIRLNLKELIDPYLTRLEEGELRSSQRQLVDLIRVNLDEVVASSMPGLSSKYYIFSPNELQVVNLIRKGKTTKEMARLLNLSSRTVESYRNSIRKKLDLKNKKVNLRTYLLSI